MLEEKQVVQMEKILMIRRIDKTIDSIMDMHNFTLEIIASRGYIILRSYHMFN